MKCPVCTDVRMREVEKDGVLIDICPDCKGVWLDRGELDKLMAEVREARQDYNEWQNQRNSYPPNPQQQPPVNPNPPYDNRYYDNRQVDHRHYDPKYRQPYGKYKKKSVFDRLGDLFD